MSKINTEAYQYRGPWVVLTTSSAENYDGDQSHIPYLSICSGFNVLLNRFLKKAEKIRVDQGVFSRKYARTMTDAGICLLVGMSFGGTVDAVNNILLTGMVLPFWAFGQLLRIGNGILPSGKVPILG